MKIELTPRRENTRYSSALEAGDYVPYFYIAHGDRKLDMQLKASADILLIFLDAQLNEAEISEALKTRKGYQVYFIAQQELSIHHDRLFHDAAVYRLFMNGTARYGFFVCDRNLKIRQALQGDELHVLLQQIPEQTALPVAALQPPILIVPDVISTDLAQRLITHLEDNSASAYVNTGSFKSRSHIHPSKALELELDNKLCKSMLPEISKVFYSDITHRETYKICCYDAGEKGAFGKHRDTIHPHLHRRYALTLVLNDDFEGGGIFFPEYSDELIQVPRCSAIIFPGSLYHQVKEIGKGRRHVLVSFLFTEKEARLKADSERYRFLVERDICDIPINRLAPQAYDPAVDEAMIDEAVSDEAVGDQKSLDAYP